MLPIRDRTDAYPDTYSDPDSHPDAYPIADAYTYSTTTIAYAHPDT